MNETNSKTKSSNSSLARFTLRTFLLLIALCSIGAWYLGEFYNREIHFEAPQFWDTLNGDNIRWSTKLGSQSYGTPALSKDYVFVGTNNAGGYDPNFAPSIDLGVLLCFEKQTGKFVWQYSAEKLSIGRASDWPLQGITGSPFVEDDRLWLVNNRGEVVCQHRRR